MRKSFALLALLTILIAPRFAHAQAVASSFDACAQFPKSSAPINIATATTTQIVAASTGGSSIYVCGFHLNQVNGTGTVQWEYGTGTACATGTTALTGLLTAATTANGTTTMNIPERFGAGSQMTVPANNALCILSTGTIQQSGWVSYVQQPYTNTANFFDPCTQYPKLSVPINISSATTTQLVALVANTQISVCSISLQQAGGAGPATLILEQGTGTACATGTAALTGPDSGGLTAGANATQYAYISDGTSLSLSQGTALCALSTTSTTQTGWLTFVQR